MARGGDKGKGIAREKQGPYKQEDTYHPYKENLTRGYGEGSSFRGRRTGYGDRRVGLHPKGFQYQRNGEGEQRPLNPTKLMLDAFKGARRSPAVGAIKMGESEGNGSSSKARKMLSFEDSAPEVQMWAIGQENAVGEDAPSLQEQGVVDEYAKVVAEQAMHSQALDEANLMIDGVLLSDSELMVGESDDLEDWEQGEIMDFTEEEILAAGVQALGDQELEDQAKEEFAQVDPENQIEGVDEGEEAITTKGVKPETAVAGGTKKRVGLFFVSPRKKLMAKVAAKQGEKAKRGPPKAKNSAV
ncbi:unnamed protein product [Brassica oleracea]